MGCSGGHRFIAARRKEEEDAARLPQEKREGIETINFKVVTVHTGKRRISEATPISLVDEQKFSRSGMRRTEFSVAPRHVDASRGALLTISSFCSTCLARLVLCVQFLVLYLRTSSGTLADLRWRILLYHSCPRCKETMDTEKLSRYKGNFFFKVQKVFTSHDPTKKIGKTPLCFPANHTNHPPHLRKESAAVLSLLGLLGSAN